MSTMEALFTKHDYARLPEGFPAQLIEGQLVREAAPLYGHQQVVGRLYRSLCEVCDPTLVLLSPVDCPIDELNVFQPDVAIYGEPPPPDEGGTLVPRVVFEVLSPSTAARDRDPKLRRYLAAGVEEVWLLDRKSGSIEVHTPRGARVAHGPDSLRSGCVPSLVLVPDELFCS